MSTLPVLFVSHGATRFTAAPGDPTHRFFASLAPAIAAARPAAIAVVSAHFLTTRAHHVTTSPAPPLVHDHPATEWYGERYAPPGHPRLAAELLDALARAGVPARADAERGLDHGAWLPLRAMAPHADVPVVMVSLREDDGARASLALGAALAPLRARGTLVLASGGATHNLGEFRRRFFSGAPLASQPPAWSVAFDDWLRDLVRLPPPERAQAIQRHTEHPRYPPAHPTPEHLWPLWVAIGAAGGDPGRAVHAGHQHGLSTTAFLFGDLPGAPAAS